MISLLIDTDTGIDDAVALALAARLTTLSIVAITTVHGNVDTARATRNARAVARLVGLDAPVIAGAAAPLVRAPRPARETHGDEGLGHVHPAETAREEPDRAAETIVTLATIHKPLTVCCLGPLTNLARALALEPALATRLGPVFVMGGALAVPGTMTRWSEFNWWADPEAVHAVLRGRLDVRLVPLDVTRRIALSGAAIASIETAGRTDAAARFWADALRFYAEFHSSYEGLDGCVINDPLAVALVHDSSLAGWRELSIGISLGDDDRRGAIALHPSEDGAPVRVAVSVRARAVLELIREFVFARWLTTELAEEGAHAAAEWLAEHSPEMPGY